MPGSGQPTDARASLLAVRDAIKAALHDLERERVEAVVLLALADTSLGDAVDGDETIERVATGIVSDAMLEANRARGREHGTDAYTHWYTVPFGAFDDNEITAMCGASDAMQVTLDRLEIAADTNQGLVV